MQMHAREADALALLPQSARMHSADDDTRLHIIMVWRQKPSLWQVKEIEEEKEETSHFRNTQVCKAKAEPKQIPVAGKETKIYFDHFL